MKKTVEVRKRLLALFVLVTLTAAMAMPLEAEAASKKGKTGYSIAVTNINSDTVLRKGQKLKIICRAVKVKNGRVSGTKVRFKSSNKRVATVSSKGVIRAKKKGTVKITVYCKSKPGKKKTIKIRVGTPVSAVRVSGAGLLHRGYSTSYKATVSSNATNKKVLWVTDDPYVAAVSASGKVTGTGTGTATIYAVAADGSGAVGSRVIRVYAYTRDSANWVAHRGLHTSAVENTAAAFEAAGRAGFRAAECDVWETKHVAPARYRLPTDTGSTEPVDQAAIDALRDLISQLSADRMSVIDQAAEVTHAKEIYDGLSAQDKYEARTQLGDAALNKLFDAMVWVGEYESFDIVINHDASFERTMGYDMDVTDMTAGEIRSESRLKSVCFFDEYLSICKRYSMTPYVEIKNAGASDMAIKKIVDMIYDMDGSGAVLAKSCLCSFYDIKLLYARDYAKTLPGGKVPYTSYLINTDVSAKIDLAKNRGYNGIGISKGLMNDAVWAKCAGYGLGVGVWTYKNTESDILLLQDHLLSGRYSLAFATVDYKPF